MAVHDTRANNRTWMTRYTLDSIVKTVDLEKHRLIISDNGSCDDTHRLYGKFDRHIERVLYNKGNIGTARAINNVWELRRENEHAVKMDNDVVIHQSGWADLFEEVFQRDPTIGICGLKRKDLEERPDHPEDWARSTLRMLPHKRGERWLVVEEVCHVMGTCQAYSDALLHEIGFLYQPGLYGFDDSLAAVRTATAGFKSAFLLGIEIDHIDPGGTEFARWKGNYARDHMHEYNRLADGIRAGKIPYHYSGTGKIEVE
jgi:GT2 family glycosyltransferase